MERAEKRRAEKEEEDRQRRETERIAEEERKQKKERRQKNIKRGLHILLIVMVVLVILVIQIWCGRKTVQSIPDWCSVAVLPIAVALFGGGANCLGSFLKQTKSSKNFEKDTPKTHPHDLSRKTTLRHVLAFAASAILVFTMPYTLSALVEASFTVARISNGDLPPPMIIEQEDVKFYPDSAEYRNPKDAEKALAKYAEFLTQYFIENPDTSVYLVGATANPFDVSDDYKIELSKRRAQTVRNTLIDLGIDENKIIAVGVGSNDPWREEDRKNGQLIRRIADRNRRVLLIPSNSPDIERILEIVSELNTPQ
jgi:outer membrane protein OmpA-like peptidoglycan-associated protein